MTNKKLGKADLHIHSSSSYDGLDKPEVILKKASEMGLNVIAITDHDEIKGALLAQKLEKKYGVEVIIGEEILSNQGEILALFIKEKVEPGKTLEETVYSVHSQGGLAIIPHPFSIFPFTRPAVGLKRLYELIHDKDLLPDGIEVMNSMPTARLSSKKSKKLNEKIFNLAEVAGSDAHVVEHIGMSLTFFPGETSEDLKKAILERTTTVAGDFISAKEHAKVVRRSIVKMSMRASRKILKPYYKLKNSIHNRFNT